nr:hypothetical protein [Rickettsia rhipicephali]
MLPFFHDTIEDTILTHADISKIFDKNIADSVERLTRIKPYGKISSGEMLTLQNKKKYFKQSVYAISFFNFKIIQNKKIN